MARVMFNRWPLPHTPPSESARQKHALGVSLKAAKRRKNDVIPLKWPLNQRGCKVSVV